MSANIATASHAEAYAVVAELAEHEEFERWRASRAPAMDEADAWRQKLAGAVRGDIANAAVLIAAMASLANAIEGRAPTATERVALGVFTPRHTGYFCTAVERLLASDLGIDDCWCLQAYIARLELALRLSQQLVRAGTPGTADHASGGREADAEIHADAWRRAATAAVAVIEALDRLLAVGETRARAREHDRTLDMLRAAAHGGTPCLDAEGRVTVPGWAERRRESRLALNVVASMVIADRKLAVIIRDASPSGLGLTLSAEVEAGAAVAVHLADGRVLDGRIAWAIGRRAGVRLEKRLEPEELAQRRR